MKAEGKRSKAPLHGSLRPAGRTPRSCCSRCSALTAGQARGLVHGPVLRAVLPDPDAEGRRHTANLLIAVALAARHAVLHRVRLAVRQDRPQADHPGRLPDRGADLLPAVQGAHQATPTRRSTRRSESAPVDGRSPIRPTARSSSTRSARATFTALLRHRQVAAWPRSSVNYDNDAGAGRHRRAGRRSATRSIRASTPPG